MAYLGKSPNGSGVRTKFVYTASGSETSLSGADDNGNTLKFTDGEYVDVYLNGVLLVHGSDYGTGTTNTISSLNALTASDVVEILVYDIFTMAKVNSEVIRSRYYKTASGSETSISGADDSGATITFAANAEIEVKVNGVSLVQGTDYNTSSANTVGGLSALTAGQVVEIIVYSKFTLGDTVSKADGGTFGGNIAVNGDLTVDTTTLKVDSSNNRGGIGTASPAVLIHGTASAPELRITSSSDSNTPAARMYYTGGSGWNFRLGDAANNEDVKISTHGDSLFNGGNVGIGTTDPNQLLSVGGSSSGTKVIQVTNSTAGTAFNKGMQMFINDTAGGLNMRENYPLQFYVNGSERLRITSAGNVGIGTASPGQLLEISGGAPIIRLTDTGASNNYSEINADYTSGSLQISADTANASSNSRIIFAVDNTEVCRIRPSGIAIGGTGDANTLDDYEEGDWTPGISFGGSTTGITYSSQSGKYTKIGRAVHIIWRFYLSSKGSASGHARITGLPFTPGNVPTGGVFLYISNRGNVNTSDEHLYGYLDGSNQLSIYSGDNDGTGNSAQNQSAFANNSELEASMTYFTS